jgi:peptidoglycan/LPS O-acetylase OafA/YrhL
VAEHAAAVYLDNVRTGRFERSLSGLAAVGALVTGAEIFVLLSGVVLGIVHRRRTARAGWTPSVRALLRRSLTLYLTSVMVVLAVFLLRFLPRLDDQSLTTYTDDPRGGCTTCTQSRSSRGPVPWGSPACLRPR